MKRSKRQDPRSREDPSTKVRNDAHGSTPPTWRDEQASSEAMVLNDGLAKHGESRHAFDLLERTAVFGERIVRFSKSIPRGPTNDRLIDQLVGCGTSVGANYCEANEGVSKKDFRHPISRCIKEAKETKFFLRMIVASEPQLADEARTLYREANELLLIFASMYRK
jgi:four helix bundle protein